MKDSRTSASVIDTLHRPLRSLRISVTDRCNIRCQYCMPEENYIWLPREGLLHFEEISALVDIFLEIGAERVRLTGGEPLLRRNLPALITMLASKPGLRDLALTTNGILLGPQAKTLFDAGLHRITVSLDTLRADRFRLLTRNDGLERVLKGIESAVKAGAKTLKIDSVIMRGTNDDEIVDLIEYGKQVGAEVRFIEYMDVGGATRWTKDKVMSRADILGNLEQHYGLIKQFPPEDAAPAERFSLPDGTVFGIIASTTAPFCRTCDRSRLTADGIWYLCLYAPTGIDLKTLLRTGVPKDEIRDLMISTWQNRTDRGAEERLENRDRSPLIRLGDLRKDPHLEMHTRGG